MKNKLLITIGLLGTFLNLYLAIEFYNKISKIFVIFIIMLQITKATYLYMLPLLNKKVVFIMIIFLCSLFDLVGVIANCYNTLLISNNQNYKVVSNYKYKEHQKQVNSLNLAIKEAENKINSYSSLDSFTSSSPEWEDKTSIISIWQDGKNKLLDTKNKLENNLLELNKNIPSKTIKIKVANNGYENLFKSDKKLNLILSICFALLMEMIIYSSFLARKFKTENLRLKNLRLKVLNKSKKSLKILDQKSKKLVLNLDKSKNLRPKNKVLNFLDPTIEAQSKKSLKILDQKSKKILDQKSKKSLKSLRLKVLNESKKSLKVLDQNKIDEVLNFLILQYKPDEKVKKFQTQFNLTLSDYRKMIEILKEKNVIYTENKNTYLKNYKIKGVK